MHAHAQLSPAMEDYLEAILRLSGEMNVARVRDIARAVGVALSTVSGALKHLRRLELVNYKPYEVITLTPRGREVARRISRRHELSARFFSQVLGVARETADADACRIEHGLSRDTVDRLIAFMEFLEDCPRAGEDWVRRFRGRCRKGVKRETCLRCIERCGEAAKNRSSRAHDGKGAEERAASSGHRLQRKGGKP